MEKKTESSILAVIKGYIGHHGGFHNKDCSCGRLWHRRHKISAPGSSNKRRRITSP